MKNKAIKTNLVMKRVRRKKDLRKSYNIVNHYKNPK